MRSRSGGVVCVWQVQSHTLLAYLRTTCDAAAYMSTFSPLPPLTPTSQLLSPKVSRRLCLLHLLCGHLRVSASYCLISSACIACIAGDNCG